MQLRHHLHQLVSVARCQTAEYHLVQIQSCCRCAVRGRFHVQRVTTDVLPSRQGVLMRDLLVLKSAHASAPRNCDLKQYAAITGNVQCTKRFHFSLQLLETCQSTTSSPPFSLSGKQTCQTLLPNNACMLIETAVPAFLTCEVTVHRITYTRQFVNNPGCYCQIRVSAACFSLTSCDQSNL